MSSSISKSSSVNDSNSITNLLNNSIVIDCPICKRTIWRYQACPKCQMKWWYSGVIDTTEIVGKIQDGLKDVFSGKFSGKTVETWEFGKVKPPSEDSPNSHKPPSLRELKSFRITAEGKFQPGFDYNPEID